MRSDRALADWFSAWVLAWLENDWAGFATVVVEKRKRLDPKENVRIGDIMIGLPSSGLHSNGYSLVRKVFPARDWKKWGSILLKPTKLYVKDVLKVIKTLNNGNKKGVKGVVHITGGGFTDNIPRILPKTKSAQVLHGSWPIPKVFKEIQKRSGLSDAAMFRTFNMGIGMVLIVSPKAVKHARRILPKSYLIGEITKGKRNVTYV